MSVVANLVKSVLEHLCWSFLMELELNTQGDHHFLRKYLFNTKIHRSDGLILQVNHSYSDSCGDVKKYRFIHVSFNDFGTCLALADHGGNIFVIDLEMERYWQLPNVGNLTVIAFPVSRKKDLLISLDTGCVAFYHIETGQKIGSLIGHTAPATDTSFSDDGCYCLTSCNKEAIVWDLLSYTQVHRLELRSGASLKKVVFMPVTSHILACFQDDTINIWKFGTFECIKQIIPETWKTRHLRDVAMSKNGRAMVVAGHTPNLVVFCLDSWTVKKVVEFPENIPGIKQLQFVPKVFDGGANKILALLTTSLEIYFFDIETSTFLMGMHQIFGMTGKISINSTGKYLASVFTTGEVNIYGLEKVLSNGEVGVCNNSTRILGTGSSQTFRNLSNRSRRSQKSNQSLSSIKKQLQEVLDLKKLQPILKQFGEYPESYRLLIWKTILQLPENQEAFMSLTTKPCHSSYVGLESKYPLVNRSLCNGLKRLLSNLSYWCPLFGEVNFLPEFVFPFVKLFRSDPLGCFEVVATIIVYWCQNWFEFYPFPPINMLSVLENVLGHHDPDLLEFYFKNNVTSSITICPLFHTAFSEVLSKTEWLKLWDHILSNEPSFLFMAMVAYNVVCRHAIKNLNGSEQIEKFFRTQNPIDMKMLISKTYQYLKDTPEQIHSRQFFAPFRPLGNGGTYVPFLAYPKLIIDPNVEKLQSIRKEEEKILEEQMKALTIKQKLEKKLRNDDKILGQERMFREVEDKIRHTVEEEEDRILAQRQKLRNLRQELRLKELEVLENTRDRMLKDRQKRKELELERLMQDVSKQRAREKVEIDMMEEEIRKYYSELLLKKCQLETELNFNSDIEAGPNLEVQRQKLKKDLCENEWVAKQHNKRIEIENKMAIMKKVVNDMEIENAKEIARKQSEERNAGIEKLKSKVKDLENQMERLLQKNLQLLQKRQGKKTTTRNLQEKPSHTANKKNNNKKLDDGEKTSQTKVLAPKKQGHEESIKKVTTIRKVKQGSQVRQAKNIETVKTSAVPIFRKPKSKLTCRKDCKGWHEESDVIGDNEERNTDCKLSDNDDKPVGEETVYQSKCACGNNEGEYGNLGSKGDASSDDYSFGSDSESEIFKSALKTRKQIIGEAKRRQKLQ
ncbi:hypothetical protein RUM44_011598 [Polyplax serrata]|uniref:TBC1 domain family member 31 n=1 Tax=Polyplax serrata TaxID=468196 RepID=A0ABR1AQH1_POLSC